MVSQKTVQEHISRIEGAADNECIKIEDVRELITAIKALFEGDFSKIDLKLYGELGELARYINDAKKELQDFQPNTLSEEKLPDASDQLAAIVSTTEEATRKIMDSCDEINATHERVRDRLLSLEPALDPDVMASIEDSLMEAQNSSMQIYEACTFQDLTGQRIQKIVETLKEVERQVLRMVIVFGLNGENAKDIDADKKKELQSDADLLNGPQLPGNSLEQGDIDDILNQLL